MVDYWTLGCLVFEMVMGYPPFRAKGRNKKDFYEVIKKGEYNMPVNLDEDLSDFIKSLLIVNVAALSSSPLKDWGQKAVPR